MHHNYIANSSIIINIIVNGHNNSRDELEPADEFPELAGIRWILEPGFGQPTKHESSEESNEDKYQQPDFGMLKITGRHPPRVDQVNTEPPA